MKALLATEDRGNWTELLLLFTAYVATTLW